MATTVDTLLVRIEADMEDLRRDMQRVTRSVESQTDAMSRSFQKVGRAIAALAGGYGLGSFIKASIQTGASMEGLRIQLNGLLGSAEQGALAFDKMASFAANVPFSLDEIQRSSGSLAAASKNADQLGELLQVTGNIAAQFSIPFDQAAENVQRAMSAGAASADLFQQKGVNAFMGFQAGVSYSSAETTKRLLENFGTGGKYDGAMGLFAKTTGGALSMFQDAMHKIRLAMAEGGLNDGFKKFLQAITDILNNSTDLVKLFSGALGAAFSGLASVVNNAASIMKAFSVVVLGLAATQIPAIVASISSAVIGFSRYVNVLNISIVAAQAMAAAQNALNIAMSAMGGPIGVTIGLMTAAASAAYMYGSAHDTLEEKLEAVAKAEDKLKKAMDAFNETNSQASRDAVVSLAGDLDQLRDAASQAAAKQLQLARATLASFAAIEAQDIDPNMELEGSFLQGEAQRLRNRISFLEGVIADAEGSGDGVSNLPVRQPTSFSSSAETNAKAASKLKSILESTKSEYTKIKEQIDLVTAAMPNLSGAMKAQAEDALVVLQQKLAETEPFYASYKDAVLSMSSQISNAFADMLVNGKFNMDSLKDVFKNFVKMMIAKALELYVFNRIIGSVFGIPMQRTSMGAYIPAAASGGSVTSGRATLVGERGPELFVPHTAGTIMNSNNTRSAMGGGAGPTIVQNINFATGIQGTVRAEVMNMLPLIAEQSKAAVADGVRRGGKYKGAFA